MSVKISRKLALAIAIISLSLALISQADSEDNSTIERVHSDVDESSCICGLNRDILDRLELIIKSSQKNNSSHCTIEANSSFSNNSSSKDDQLVESGSNSNNNNNFNTDQDRTPKPTTTTTWGGEWPSGSSNLNQIPYQNYRPTNGQFNGNVNQQQNFGQQQQGKERPAQQANNEFNSQYSNSQTRPPTSSWSSDYNQQKPSSSNWFNGNNGQTTGQQSTGIGSQTPYWQTNYNNNNNNDSPSLQSSNDNQQQQQRPVNSGFLQGIIGSDGANELAKLNQTSQQINSSDIQNALESTIPSLVSNIFSNIQNITIQTENGGKYPIQANGNFLNANGQSNNLSANILTSIDGSSVQLHGNTTEQITAQGEELFMQWIEHQIHMLKLTASTANYIRKSALNLFRRIVKQYVERIERLGGRVEDNVKQATQVALNNTQNLIAYILRNYINFAGGLMQIIGESVSRFGKRIDSTGETIASVNLNPFDIVSDVIDSLPNPSHYSEYFRAFGKYLMGESSQSSSNNNDNSKSNNNNSDNNNNNDQSQEQQQQASNSNNAPTERPKGLLSKAMGSLGKTFGAWIG